MIPRLTAAGFFPLIPTRREGGGVALFLSLGV
jgi:hypothetical protein